MQRLERLEWDSDFFGFPVARIIDPQADCETIRAAVSEMHEHKIRLTYWSAQSIHPEQNQCAITLGGRRVDEKQTFAAPISSQSMEFESKDLRIETYRDTMPLAELKQLAVDSGVHSRFAVDENFPQDKTRAMFETWMVRSLNGTLADRVLVVCDQEHVVGMVTLARRDLRGQIGLLAVCPSCRGRGLGVALVRAAFHWCVDQGLDQIQVVTQQRNVPATTLYRKCGLQLLQTEFIYHFWSSAT